MEAENKITTDIAHKKPDTQGDIISYFKNDSDFVFAYKKTEKLSTAVYLITNLLSDNEPIKWTLRKKVSDLLSAVLEFKDIFASEQNAFLTQIKTRVLELTSLLEISSRSGLVSNMNFSVLKQEFGNLVSTLESSFLLSKELPGESLSEAFFGVEEGDFARSSLRSAHSHVSHTAVRDTGRISHIKNTTQEKVQSKNTALDAQVIKRTNRQNIILTLLRKRGELTIKDISEVIKDCSEKTIQRELTSFISAGVLKRKGQRRWSRYSLA